MNSVNNVIYREYLPTDYDQVDQVNTTCLRVSFSYLYNLYHKKHPNLFLVAEEKDEQKIVAFILVDINGGEIEEKSALVYAIAVLPDYQKQGIGKTLIQKTIKNLRKYPNVKKLYLHVQDSNNGAYDFYVKLRFKFIKTIKSFYSWGEDAHQLSIPL